MFFYVSLFAAEHFVIGMFSLVYYIFGLIITNKVLLLRLALGSRNVRIMSVELCENGCFLKYSFLHFFLHYILMNTYIQS